MNSLKVYDKTGKLIIDQEHNYYDCAHVTINEWREIFRTHFKTIKIHDKDGNVIVDLSD